MEGDYTLDEEGNDLHVVIMLKNTVIPFFMSFIPKISLHQNTHKL